MKLVHVLIPSLSKKGPVIIADNIAKSLQLDSNFEVVLFYIGDSQKSIKTNYRTVRLDHHSIREFLKADIIHSHGLLPDLLSYFLKPFTKAKFITTIHNNVFDDPFLEYSHVKAWLISKVWPLTWKNKDKMVCITDTALDYYHQIPVDKKIRIYNGIEPPVLSYNDVHDNNILKDIARLKNQGKLILGTCAVITKRKGIEQLISAVGMSEGKYHAIIIGDGEHLEQLISYTKEINIESSVTFLGRVEEPHRIISSFNLYVMPSLEEGFGIAPIEAASLGVPILVSDINTFNELYEGFDIKFELGNPVSLRDRANEIIDCSTSDNTLNLITAKFSAEKMNESYKALYNVVGRK